MAGAERRRRLHLVGRNTDDAMRPTFGANCFVNYLGDDAVNDAVADAYGPNYRRLQQLKSKYDPDKSFI